MRLLLLVVLLVSVRGVRVDRTRIRAHDVGHLTAGDFLKHFEDVKYKEALDAIKPCLDAPPATTHDLIALYSAEEKQQAVKQGVPAMIKFAKYTDYAVSQTCNQGNCDKWKQARAYRESSGGFAYSVAGGQGEVKLSFTPPAKLNVTLQFQSGTLDHMACTDVATPAMKCSEAMWRGYNSDTKIGTFESVLKGAQELQTFTKITKKCFVTAYVWLTVSSSSVVNNAFAVVAPFDAYKPSEVSRGLPLVTEPDKYSYITSCLKKPSLSKTELKSYFPADKMKFAALQGVPALTKLGKYATTHFARTCKSGQCIPWRLDDNFAHSDYTGFYRSGGAGASSLYSNELGQLTLNLDFDGYPTNRGTYLQCKNDVFWSSTFTCAPKLTIAYYQAGGRDRDPTSGRSDFLADKKLEEQKFHIARDCFVASFRYSKVTSSELTEGEIYITPDPGAKEPYPGAGAGPEQTPTPAPTAKPTPTAAPTTKPTPKPDPKQDPQPGKPDQGHHTQQHHEQKPQAKEGGQQPQKQQPAQQPKQQQPQAKHVDTTPDTKPQAKQEADARLTPADGQQGAAQQRPASAR